ncbi:hypothetical protein EDE15_5154 [Edaphobacter aggregans]|uniref:Uncharacterized protein n=1 Tax=Edaphobacter aggregans TaxID=570835 RepID=A0A3R9PDW2_9BACT|nr:hypothetical protein [Edaphobacter aggregans]RSL19485.1 hypothetical protein EDE15_5154 [Edaphobacter aggregans]
MKILRAAIMGALLLTGSSVMLHGQLGRGSNQTQNPLPPVGQGNMGGLGGRNEAPDPLGPRIQEQQAKSRNSDRQRKLVEDTERLLSLAADLKQQMGNTGKDAMSADMVRKAEEIEKLAKSVKERMKG